MQAPIPIRSRRSALCRLAALFVVAGTLAACDRHSAQEVPESYGHGSPHIDPAAKESFTDHETDSSGKFHFSDTVGTTTEEAATPAASPAPTSAPATTPTGHFF